MKFGKRRKDADPPDDDGVTVATSETPTDTATESWTVPDAGAVAAADAAPPYEPQASAAPPPFEQAADAPGYDPAPAANDFPPYAPGEQVVEGEAVEIPPAEPEPQPEPAAAYEPPVAAYVPPPPAPTPEPEPMAAPFPVAEQPVVVTTSGAEPEQATPLGAAAETFASGHGPASGPAWPQGVQELAAERPEILVGAAFVGGIVAAMIIRRLGN